MAKKKSTAKKAKSRMSAGNVGKSDLVRIMAKDAGITQIEAKKALESFQETTVNAVLKHDSKITLAGFGTMKKSTTKARKAKIGNKTYNLPESSRIHFKMSATLKKKK